MINNDLKLAVRNIFRNRIPTLISITGLGIGLGSIILLMALIVHETTFDTYIPGYRDIYRVTLGPYAWSQYPLADDMKREFPGVKDFFRINQANNVQVRNTGDKYGLNQEFAFADTSIFRILGIRFLAGTPAGTVTEVAISEKISKKFFGSNSAVGEVLRVKLNDEYLTFTVTGVYRDFPANSTLYPDYIADIRLTLVLLGQWKSRTGELGKDLSLSLNWDLIAFYTYLVLDGNADRQNIINKMQKYTEHCKSAFTKSLRYGLQPLRDIYLKSDAFLKGYNFFRAGNPDELKYYWSISFLILVIAVTNYIFLARAVTLNKLHEIGTRKTIGATSWMILRQTVLESNLISLLSLIPASLVIGPGISLINNTLNKTLSFQIFSDPVLWIIVILIILLTGTVSGMLISLRISGTPSLKLLNGIISRSSGPKKWDYSFLVLHFTIYIILAAGVIALTKQVRYTVTSQKGINTSGVIISELYTPALQSGFTAISTEIGKIPGVMRVAGATNIPLFSDPVQASLPGPQGEKIPVEFLSMGEGMTELLNIDMVEGSVFGTFKPDEREFLFNESAARKYNIRTGEKFLGLYHVRGIVRDFNSHSSHTSIEPTMIMQETPLKMSLLAIKTDGKNDKAVISKLGELYHQIAPDEIFNARYLSDESSKLYTHEKNQARIIGAFSLLATMLSMMGLFGIAMISCRKRSREIGLRKVNGASVSGIMTILSADFARWVLVAIPVAIPSAYYLIAHWQDRFAYKTGLSWWIFALAAASALVITLITISWNTWRAAIRNPVESLRHE